MSISTLMATENCIVCGKKATTHAGSVNKKERMALGNYVDIKVAAGWCEDHFKTHYREGRNGELNPEMPLIPFASLLR